jgi:hypothetical protein
MESGLVEHAAEGKVEHLDIICMNTDFHVHCT